MSNANINPSAIQKLDESSQKELMQWIEQETSRSKVQGSIHNFTDICFKKCVTKADSSTLSSKEETCLSNCLHRFLDTNINIVNMIQQSQGR